MQEERNMTRRKHKAGRFVWLLDDENMTAWIDEGTTGGAKVYTLPEKVVAEGKEYVAESVEIGAFFSEAELEELFIPDCYTYIDEDSFRDCGKLRTIHIGSGLRNFFPWSFSCCPVERIIVSPENPNIRVSDDGTMMLSRDGSKLLSVFRPTEHITVPDGVREIGACGLSCNDITRSVTLPLSLEKIGSNGIYELNALKELVLSEGVREIGTQGLSWNPVLELVDLPSTLHALNWELFAEDESLQTLILRSRSVVDAIPSDVKYLAVENCRLVVPHDLAEDYRRHPVWGAFKSVEAI